jgi:hypothetical protein
LNIIDNDQNNAKRLDIPSEFVASLTAAQNPVYL